MNPNDRKILWLFLGFYIGLLLMVPVYVIVALIGNFDIPIRMIDTLSWVFSSFTVTIFIIGILAYKYHRNNGILSIRSINIWFYRASLLVSAGIIGLLAIFVLMARMGFFDSAFLNNEEPLVVVLALLGMYIGFTLAIWLGLFVFMIFGFGIVSLIAVLTKGATPEILDEISKITDNTTIQVKRKDSMSYWKYYFLQWFFHIPYVLDTKNLTLEKYKQRKKLPWREIRLSVLSHLLFGFVIIIYISFNPLLLANIEFTALFSLGTNAVIFVPLIIIPWFIYYRLRVRIKVRIHAPVIRSFNLYHGVKHRMTRILVAAGTLLLFIRLGIQQANIVEIFSGLFSFFIFFTVAVLIISFVYYNFYENDLVKDVYDTYNRKYGKQPD